MEQTYPKRNNRHASSIQLNLSSSLDPLGFISKFSIKARVQEGGGDQRSVVHR